MNSFFLAQYAVYTKGHGRCTERITALVKGVGELFHSANICTCTQHSSVPGEGYIYTCSHLFFTVWGVSDDEREPGEDYSIEMRYIYIRAAVAAALIQKEPKVNSRC